METKVRFSGKEITHLVVSVLVMSVLVAAHMGFKTISSAISADIVAGLIVFAFYLGLSFVVIIPAFIFHEMGHKFLAQKFGFWAEYRMWTQGILMAVLMLVIFRGSLLFLAPGAVYFAPQGFRGETKEKVGK